MSRTNRSNQGRSPGPNRPDTGLPGIRGGAPDDGVDADELNRLRVEVERLRNELFLAQEEIARARRRGRAEVYQRLVDALGHELRTSLTIVLGWTELLINARLPQEKRSAAYDTIYAAGWRIEATLRWLERLAERDLHPLEHKPGARLDVEPRDRRPPMEPGRPVSRRD